jgi:sn-glycerol 3-phosphate transport system ATP-binding protein
MLGFRAEDLVADPGSDGIEILVTYVEELGASRLVHGTHEGTMLVAATPADQPLTERMRFSIRPDRLHYFDLQSGRRI